MFGGGFFGEFMFGEIGGLASALPLGAIDLDLTLAFNRSAIFRLSTSRATNLELVMNRNIDFRLDESND